MDCLIFLTSDKFKGCHLHFEHSTKEYYLFVNSKKHNRNLKKMINELKKCYRKISGKEMNFYITSEKRILERGNNNE